MACQCSRCKRPSFGPWFGKIPWRKKWQPAPVFLPGESHGQRSLAGYSPESGTINTNSSKSVTYGITVLSLWYLVSLGCTLVC